MWHRKRDIKKEKKAKELKGKEGWIDIGKSIVKKKRKKRRREREREQKRGKGYTWI